MRGVHQRPISSRRPGERLRRKIHALGLGEHVPRAPQDLQRTRLIDMDAAGIRAEDLVAQQCFLDL